MLDRSEKLVCEIQLQIAPGGEVVTSPKHYHRRNSDNRFETYRFYGSIRSLGTCSNDTTADAKKVLSLLLSRGVKVYLKRFLGHPESHVGFIYFKPSDIVRWRTGYSFPYSHLRIEVSRAEWESLDFYVDGLTKWPHLLK